MVAELDPLGTTSPRASEGADPPGRVDSWSAGFSGSRKPKADRPSRTPCLSNMRATWQMCSIVPAYRQRSFSATHDQTFGAIGSRDSRAVTSRCWSMCSLPPRGFDLPDASCILVTRPTKSLALYMQMNGRGMRPKDDCLILDMAYNSEEHGLPDEDREWSLEPRGSQIDGVAPFVHCEVCGEESSITSHECGHCGEPFGDECDRCGKWRAWASWESDEYCEYEHDRVCDYCHLDAHIQASLPVDDQLRDELAGLIDEDMGAGEANRRSELLRLIGERERLLNDEGALDSEFKKHIEGLTKTAASHEHATDS